MLRVFFACMLVLGAGVCLAPRAFTQSEGDDQRKRDLFLRSREDIRPVPKATQTPRPKPTPSTTITPAPAPKRAPKPSPTPTPKPTPKPTPARPEKVEAPDERPARPASTPDEKPATRDRIERATRGSERPATTSTPSQTIQSPAPAPAPRPSRRNGEQEQATPRAPITVEKSGLEEDQGLVSPSTTRGGIGKRYRYLTPAVRRAIDRAPVRRGRWKYTIIHNSGTRQGNAKAFDNYHRRVRKMHNGLAYHFVIGNGRSSGNGEIEVGNRWVRQINGGHVASDYLNNIAIGICLVGDFNRDLPTRAQAEALEELIAYLRQRVGKTKGRNSIVLGHRQINPKPTDCPGNRFPLRWLNARFRNN